MIELGRHHRDAPVAVGTGERRTAGQLAGLAAAIGAALAGLPEGAKVVLACQDRYYFAACLLALWERGLVAVLPPNGQAETVRALSREPWAAALLHDRDDDVGSDVRSLERTAEPCEPRFPVRVPWHATAVIAFTSGSSGKPAAHDKTLAQLVEEPRALIEAFGLAERRIVASVPPYHLYGLLFGVLVPLIGGGTLSRTSPLQAPEVLRELSLAGADVLVAVPPHLSALSAYLHETGVAVPRLARVFSSGAPLPEATDSALRACGMTVTQVLGSTETGGIASRERAGDAPWLTLPQVAVSVVEGDVLCVASPWCAAEPGSTVRTADRVALTPGGFRHLGRADQVVKVAGRRIDLGDIEARLRRVAGVRDARVLAVDTASLRGVELWAVVEGQGTSVPALKRALSQELDPVTLPRRYRVVDALPRTAAGKLERTVLLSLFDTWHYERTTGEDGVLRVTLPKHYGYFRGHFEGDPILPGVVQLEQIALRVARERFRGLGPLARVTRVKFKRPIRPGEELAVRMELRSAQQVHFDLRAGDEVAASGIFHFRGAP